MPIVFLVLGLILATAAVRGTHRELGELWKTQFTGPRSFTAIAFALLAISTLGTIEPLRPLARAFLALVIIVLIITNSREQNLLTLIQMQLVGRSLVQNSPLRSLTP